MRLLQSIVSKIGFAESKKTDFNDGIHCIFGKNNSGKTLISKSFIDTIYPENAPLVEKDAWDTMCATFTLQCGHTKVEIQRKGNKEIKLFEIASDGSIIKEEAFPLPASRGKFFCYMSTYIACTFFQRFVCNAFVYPFTA